MRRAIGKHKLCAARMLAAKGQGRNLIPRGRIIQVAGDVVAEVGDGAPATDLIPGATPVAPGPDREVGRRPALATRKPGPIRLLPSPTHDRRTGTVDHVRDAVQITAVLLLSKTKIPDWLTPL